MTESRKPILLAILDGWGIRAERDHNAIALARKPVYDELAALCAFFGMATNVVGLYISWSLERDTRRDFLRNSSLAASAASAAASAALRFSASASSCSLVSFSSATWAWPDCFCMDSSLLRVWSMRAWVSASCALNAASRSATAHSGSSSGSPTR